MNNQFTGPTAWDDYLTALEQATPLIEAIAVTDYYVTDTYEEVIRHKVAGRLPRAVFPNVELRLDDSGWRPPPDGVLSTSRRLIGEANRYGNCGTVRNISERDWQ